MKVLSLFDWIACGYEALLRAWINIEKYYASEIDKYAIQIATKNHPDIVEIGDVCNVKGEDYKDIDLLIGGSPCQGFSMAWKMLNFDDPRSKLFFEYVRLLNEIKPKYFLLENVKMKKEFRDTINSYLRWIEPTLIDSALVSAQHRERYYRVWVLQDDWTYAKVDIPQPEDKGILLKDVIIQWGVDEKYYLTDRQIKVIQTNLQKKGKELNQTESLIEKMTFPSRINQLESLEIKTPTLCSTMWTWWGNVPCIINVVDGEVRVKQATKQWYIVAEWDGISLEYPNSTTRRGRVQKQKSNTITTWWQSYVYEPTIIRWRPKIPYEPWQRQLEYKEYSDKCPTLTENCASGDQKNIVVQWAAIRNQLVKWELETQLNIHKDEKSNCVVSSYSDKLNMVAIAYAPWSREFEQQGWKEDKSPTICARDYKDPKIVSTWISIRKLTPEECERLQTLPDKYTEGVSNTQRYKALWNWWTCDVIVHILKNLLK